MRRLVLAALFFAAPLEAQRAPGPPVPEAVGEAGGLIVSGIEVETTGKTNVEARMNGWREAQRLAWPQLWARLSGLAPDAAPRLADSALDGIVSAIEIERESVSDRRYVARLSVVFDRVRSAAYLGRDAALVQSPPFLLLPVLQDAGVRMGYEPGSPWVAAWLRFRAGESPVDYIRLRASPADSLLLSAWTAERPHIAIWRQLAERYQVADVLIPELLLDRSELGGPVSALLIARFGPGGRELGRVELSNPSGDVGALLDQAVREADALYSRALQGGVLVPTAELQPPPEVEVPDLGETIGGGALGAARSVALEVDTPDAAQLATLEARLSGLAGVRAVRTTSFVIGGRSRITLETVLDEPELARALDRAGLRIEGTLLRARRADEAPLAPAEPDVEEVPIEEVPA